MNPFSRAEERGYRRLLNPPMSAAEVETIHQAGLDLLANGIRVKHDAALDIFYSHGCRVDRKSETVRIPPSIVEKSLHSAPGRFVLAGRRPDRDVPVDGQRIFFGAISGCVRFLDPRSRIQRPPTKTDLAAGVRLVDALEDIDIANRVLVPADVDGGAVALHQLETALGHTTKHVMCSSGRKKIIRAAIEMAGVAAGGKEKLKDRPLITVLASPISPLTLADECCDTIIESARAGLPVVVALSAIGGASAPVTLAGLLAVHNTDILAGIVLAQLAAAGTPVLYSNYSGLMDMQSGLMPYGSPSLALMGRAAVQMADFYGIPSYSAGLTGDSHLPDYQAALETSVTGMTAALAGADIVTGAGTTNGIMVFSPAKLLCDCQLIQMIKQIRSGIAIDEKRLALDLIKTTGPGGDFLASDHTLEFFREQPRCELIDHSPFELWQQDGRRDMIQRASEKAVQIMQNHTPEPLDPGMVSEMKKIVAATEKEIRNDRRG